MTFLKKAALAAALAGLMPLAAFAQQPAQRPAQRPAAPAQPTRPPLPGNSAAGAPAQTGPTVVQVTPEPSQPDWTKVCGKDQAANKEICYTTRDFVSDQGQPVLAVALYDVKGEQQRILRFLMPLGLLLQPGIRFGLDQGQPAEGKFQICFPNGCFAEGTVGNDFINAVKKGGTLNVSVQNQLGREVTFQVPMANFGKAFDGPPIDPKVLEEQQKQLQEQLQKQSEDMRKKLESSGGAPAPGVPAAQAPAPTAPAPAAPAAPKP